MRSYPGEISDKVFSLWYFTLLEKLSRTLFILDRFSESVNEKQ